jgi:hypothetical protein
LASKFGTFDLGLKDSKLVLRVFDGNDVLSELVSSVSISAEKLHHVMVTFDGTTLRIYLDGRLVGSLLVDGPLKSTSTPIILGMLNTATPDTGVFSGVMDEWFVTQATMTGEQAIQMMIGRVPGTGKIADLYGVAPTSYLGFELGTGAGRNVPNLSPETGSASSMNWSSGYGRGFGCGTVGCGNSGGGGLGFPAAKTGKFGVGASFGQFGTTSDPRQDAMSLAGTQSSDMSSGFTVALWVNWGGNGENPLQWFASKAG